jgi:hypothetical protein
VSGVANERPARPGGDAKERGQVSGPPHRLNGRRAGQEFHRRRLCLEHGDIVLGRGAARHIEARVRCLEEHHGELVVGGEHAYETALVEEGAEPRDRGAFPVRVVVVSSGRVVDVLRRARQPGYAGIASVGADDQARPVLAVVRRHPCHPGRFREQSADGIAHVHGGSGLTSPLEQDGVEGTTPRPDRRGHFGGSLPGRLVLGRHAGKLTHELPGKPCPATADRRRTRIQHSVQQPPSPEPGGAGGLDHVPGKSVAEVGRLLDNADLEAGPREQHGGRRPRAATAHHDNVVHVSARFNGWVGDEIAVTAFASEIDDSSTAHACRGVRLTGARSRRCAPGAAKPGTRPRSSPLSRPW